MQRASIDCSGNETTGVGSVIRIFFDNDTSAEQFTDIGIRDPSLEHLPQSMDTKDETIIQGKLCLAHGINPVILFILKHVFICSWCSMFCMVTGGADAYNIPDLHRKVLY
jgi:hypothetical protein